MLLVITNAQAMEHVERTEFVNASTTGVSVCRMTLVIVPTVSVPMILPGLTIQTAKAAFINMLSVQDRVYVPVTLVFVNASLVMKVKHVNELLVPTLAQVMADASTSKILGTQLPRSILRMRPMLNTTKLIGVVIHR